MNALLLRLELRRSRTLLFWLGLTTILYAVFIAAYYPTLVADSELIDTMMKNFPKALMAAFGMEGDLRAQGTYFNVYLLSAIWPLLAAVAAIVIPTRTLGTDLEHGFLELPITAPVSRTRYLSIAIGAQVLVLLLLAAATIGAIVGTLALVGVAFDLGRWLLVGLLALAFACAVAALTTLLSVLTLDRGKAGGTVAGLLVLMYLAQTIAKLAPDAGGLAQLSAFHYFAPAPVLNAGAIPASGLLVFGSAALLAWGAALWLFRRRDLLR
jgi:beta-exotoxin I transport system permease protein